MHFVGLNCTLLKESPLKMSEFLMNKNISELLKNKYFFNEKSSNYNLIPEKDENVLVLREFLKNKNFVNGKSPSFSRILEKYVLC
jgi:hypothetical protein